jgi:hypothetical protein
MGDNDAPGIPPEQNGDDADEADEFHDGNGLPLLGDADASEVSLYAHHCWRLGLDPDATAAALGRS